MTSRIVYKPPPYLFLWRLFFPNCNFEKNVFVWGKDIYTKYKLDQPLFVHEYTHCEQQQLSKWYGIIWLIRYIKSPKFRLSQELEAYQNQYKYYCFRDKDKNYRAKFLNKLASDLSSPLYNNLISFSQALEAIKR